MDSNRAIQLLREGNRRFVSGSPVLPYPDPNLRSKLFREGQKPFAAVLACSDSRVPVEMIFDRGMGDLFVMRVAGNVPGPTVLGTIQYAVEVLSIPLIVVLGHEDCGAVGAAMQQASLSPPLSDLIELVNLEGCKDVPCAIQSNVQAGIRTIRDQLPSVSEMEMEGQLMLVGGVFSISSGEVSWLEIPES